MLRALIFSMIIILKTQTASAGEFPRHTFYCGILNTTPRHQVYISLNDEELEQGIAKVMISNADESSPWKVMEQTTAPVSLTWGKYRGLPAITGASINLGRSGQIMMRITEKYGEYAHSLGYLKANLMNLNFPNGIAAEYCTYFLELGPKPGMSGGNNLQ